MDILVLFDLDGVIFREDGYLICAALATSRYMLENLSNDIFTKDDFCHPDQTSSMEDAKKIRDVFLRDDVLQVLRAKAINNNWDKAFACTLGLLTLSTIYKSSDELLSHLAEWLQRQGGFGQEFLRSISGYATQWNRSADDVFTTLKNDFQRYYLGDQAAETDFLRRGILDEETTLLPPATILNVLRSLIAHGMQLGIGTGRPREEALRPLQRLGLLPYFSMDRIMTHDEVRQEEDRQGLPIGALAKPRPFVYQRAASAFDRKNTVVVGDSTADAIAAHEAGFLFYGIGSVASFGETAVLAKSINSDVEEFAHALLCSVSDLQ